MQQSCREILSCSRRGRGLRAFCLLLATARKNRSVIVSSRYCWESWRVLLCSCSSERYPQMLLFESTKSRRHFLGSFRCLRLTRHDYQLVSWDRIQRRLVDVEMCLYQLGRGVCQQIRKRQVLMEAALEHLQEDQVCVRGILDSMQQALLHVPDVSCLKVH